MIAPHWAIWQLVIMFGCVAVLLVIAAGLTWFCITTFHETWGHKERTD